MNLDTIESEAFFLNGKAGDLFAIHRKAVGKPSRCVLIVPPFAEEMNKSRRMFTLLADSLARQGISSLLIDLFGTGDSQGDFGDARWEIWIQDIECASNWIRDQEIEEVYLLGLRLGALLAADYISRRPGFASRVVFWQPVLRGTVVLSQFLRLRLAADMLGVNKSKETVKDLTQTLDNGQPLEIAGYQLAPELYVEIEKLTMNKLISNTFPKIHWFEIVASEDRPFSPASQKVMDSIINIGTKISVTKIVGDPFWSLQEITTVPSLIDRTVDVIASN